MNEVVGFILAGAVGALARDVVRDNKIQLPRYNDGVILLGFVGGMIVGGFVGWVVDGSFLTAAMGGYVGTSTIAHLLPASDGDDVK